MPQSNAYVCTVAFKKLDNFHLNNFLTNLKCGKCWNFQLLGIHCTSANYQTLKSYFTKFQFRFILRFFFSVLQISFSLFNTAYIKSHLICGYLHNSHYTHHYYLLLVNRKATAQHERSILSRECKYLRSHLNN